MNRILSHNSRILEEFNFPDLEVVSTRRFWGAVDEVTQVWREYLSLPIMVLPCDAKLLLVLAKLLCGLHQKVTDSFVAGF